MIYRDKENKNKVKKKKKKYVEVSQFYKFPETFN